MIYEDSISRDVCAIYHLCRGRRLRCHIRFPDIHQDEHGRGRHHQAYRLAGRRVPVHYRGFDRISRVLRLPHLENHECKTIIKVQLKQEKHV